MFLEISLIIISGAFLLFAVFSIPPLLQIWRTAKNMAITLEAINENLPGILKNLEEITTRINHTTAMIKDQVEDMSLVVSKVHGLMAVIANVESMLKGKLAFPLLVRVFTLLAVGKGVRAFFRALRSPQ